MYTTGEIATLCDMTSPKVGVVTLVGAVHLERAGTMENIVKAKQELVEALPADGTAILNKDDAHVNEPIADPYRITLYFGNRRMCHNGRVLN